MTVNYCRTYPRSFDELTEEQKNTVRSNYSFEESDCQSTQYVLLAGEPLPLSMFMKTHGDNKFTHGIYSIGFYAGYFITFSRDMEYCTVAYKHF